MTQVDRWTVDGQDYEEPTIVEYGAVLELTGS